MYTHAHKHKHTFMHPSAYFQIGTLKNQFSKPHGYMQFFLNWLSLKIKSKIEFLKNALRVIKK